jgi:hypothetical protein
MLLDSKKIVRLCLFNVKVNNFLKIIFAHLIPCFLEKFHFKFETETSYLTQKHFFTQGTHLRPLHFPGNKYNPKGIFYFR